MLNKEKYAKEKYSRGSMVQHLGVAKGLFGVDGILRNLQKVREIDG